MTPNLIEQAEHFKRAGRAARGGTRRERRWFADRVLYIIRMAGLVG